MSKRMIAALLICLAAASAAQAQYGGGMGGGHGGGHRGGGRRGPPGADPTQPGSPTPGGRQTPLAKVEIVGVVRAIDRPAGRITIAYEAVDALSWPEGTMPFAVSKTALLDAASLGQKVRLRIESQQITELEPYVPRRGERSAAGGR